jgi:hypothetical protein
MVKFGFKGVARHVHNLKNGPNIVSRCGIASGRGELIARWVHDYACGWG